MAGGCIRVLADDALRSLIVSFERGLPGHLYHYWLQYRTAIRASIMHGEPGELVRIAIERGDVAKLRALYELSRGSEYYKSMAILQFHGALQYAAACGRVSSVEWLHSSPPDGVHCEPAAAHVATVNNNHKTLRWLLTRCPQCSTGLCRDSVESAASRNHVKVMDLLLDTSPDLAAAPSTLRRAAESGALDVVQLLHDRVFAMHHCRDCKGVGDKAAGAGQLQVVEYLHAVCVAGFSTDAMDWAAANGHLAVVKFLHQNRCEGCTVYAMDQAAAQGWLDVVQFLHSNRTEGCTLYAMDGAARRGHFDVLEFLHLNRSEGCSAWALAEAAEKGHLAIVEFLHANRHGLDWEDSALSRAARNGHLDVVQFLCETTRVGDRVLDARRAAKSFHREAVVTYLNKQIQKLLELKESEQREKLRRRKHAKGKKKRSK